MRSVKLFALREVIVVFFSGGLPVILSYMLGGIELLSSTIDALISPDLLLYYAVGAAVLFYGFYWLDDRIYIDPLSRKQRFLNFTISTLSELSANILGIFRIFSGLLIVFPIFVLVVERESFEPIGIEFMKIGLVGLLQGGIFCWYHSKIRLKQKF